MGFEIAPLIIFGVCLALVLAGAVILLRSQWLIAWLKGTAGLALIALAVYFSLFALNLFSYHQLTREKPVATVSFKQLGPQQYVATLTQPGGSSGDYELRGDLWQLDARIVHWKGIFALLGFQPGYQLDRLRGRYILLEDERSREQTGFEVRPPAFGVDIWQQAYEGWSLMIDASYGSATFLPMADGAIYEVTLSNTGLLGRPRNEAAQQAVGRWE